MKTKLLFIFGFLTIWPALALDSELDKLQSAFIQKIVNYIEWPNIHDKNEFVVAVHSNKSIFSELSRMNETMSFGKKTKVVFLEKISRDLDAQIVYSESSEKLSEIKGSGVLFITSDEKGLSGKSVINFFLLEGKLRFDINNTNAQENHIKINSRLLNLARELK